jgi:mRNA interferase MazF
MRWRRLRLAKLCQSHKRARRRQALGQENALLVRHVALIRQRLQVLDHGLGNRMKMVRRDGFKLTNFSRFPDGQLTLSGIRRRPVFALLACALEFAVIIASDNYLRERPDVLVGILTTKIPPRPGSTDYVLKDWQAAGLRAESCFRTFVLTFHRSHLTAIGNLSDLDWSNVQACVRRAFAL